MSQRKRDLDRQRQLQLVRRELRKAERAYRRRVAAAEMARVERNNALREALGAGMTQAEVSRETRLGRSRVNQLVR